MFFGYRLVSEHSISLGSVLLPAVVAGAQAFGHFIEPVIAYTVALYRHLHAVRLTQARMRRLQGLAVLDWTREAPSLSTPLAERRRLLRVGRNCVSAELREAGCAAADLMLYLGDSGKDCTVQVGMAKAIGTPVMGIAGPLEETGLMLRNGVALWMPGPFEAIWRIRRMLRCRNQAEVEHDCRKCPAESVCTLAH